MKMNFVLLATLLAGLAQTANASELDSFLSARDNQNLSAADKQESAERFIAAAHQISLSVNDESECQASFVGIASPSLVDPCGMANNSPKLRLTINARSGGTGGGGGSN